MLKYVYNWISKQNNTGQGMFPCLIIYSILSYKMRLFSYINTRTDDVMILLIISAILLFLNIKIYDDLFTWITYSIGLKISKLLDETLGLLSVLVIRVAIISTVFICLLNYDLRPIADGICTNENYYRLVLIGCLLGITFFNKRIIVYGLDDFDNSNSFTRLVNDYDKYLDEEKIVNYVNEEDKKKSSLKSDRIRAIVLGNIKCIATPAVEEGAVFDQFMTFREAPDSMSLFGLYADSIPYIAAIGPIPSKYQEQNDLVFEADIECIENEESEYIYQLAKTEHNKKLFYYIYFDRSNIYKEFNLLNIYCWNIYIDRLSIINIITNRKEDDNYEEETEREKKYYCR